MERIDGDQAQDPARHEARRLLNVYRRRLHSNLTHDLRPLVGSRAGEVAERIAGKDIIFCNKNVLNADLLGDNGSVRFIGLTATGTDNVDLDFARASGIAVANIRAYCTQSVTEHVFGALLMLTHNLRKYSAALQRGAWQRASDFYMLDFPVRELSRMTMGIVGLGDLGNSVARTARHFGMDVVVSARPGEDTVPDGRVAFDELLERADVISLHCPLVDATRGLFGAAEFRRMKSSAILINTARGALVDTRALADALRGVVSQRLLPRASG